VTGSPNEFQIRSEAEYADALSRFPYPLTIVHGDEALAEYERLKAIGEGSPIVIGGASELAMVHEFYELKLEHEPLTEIVLERAGELRFPASLKAQIDRETELFKRQNPGVELEEEIPEEMIGDWPEQVDTYPFSLTAAYDVISGKPWPRTHIALIPTKDRTEIPAHLRAGGWNAVPDSANLVAALRSWRDRYGAEFVAASHDTMLFRVQRQPTSREEALELAREHYLFCSDALGETTLRELAAYLIENDWWFFWWD
jgi:hypothetical protein